MKRKDFTSTILNIISGTASNGYIYCDRSRSKKYPNMYFMRFKYPWVSLSVKTHFDHYKVLIKSYLDQIGVGDAEVKLNKTGWPGNRDFYYIEVVFFNGLPWRNGKPTTSPIISQKPEENKDVEDEIEYVDNPVPDMDFSSHPSMQETDMVTIEKRKLANLIRIAIGNDSKLVLKVLMNANDDLLIELYKQISK